jgi:hypothetical protein
VFSNIVEELLEELGEKISHKRSQLDNLSSCEFQTHSCYNNCDELREKLPPKIIAPSSLYMYSKSNIEQLER